MSRLEGFPRRFSEIQPVEDVLEMPEDQRQRCKQLVRGVAVKSCLGPLERGNRI